MGCMPYGLAQHYDRITIFIKVSIPHMGCMPYGHMESLEGLLNKYVSIPHMGCMPYGQI